MNKFWKMILNKAAKTAEILIYEQIGRDYWSDEGIAAKDFAADLKALGDVKDITLRLNSPGGSVFEGLVIHNLLKAHQANVTVYIDGIAASIASVIAMCGDKIIMPENAMMMIHDPSGLVIGNADDMRKMADTLDKIKESIKTAYKRTMMTDEEIDEMMKAETWLTAADAVDKGFADEMIEAVKIAAHFDLTQFKNAPLTAQKKPAALVAENKKEVSDMEITEAKEEARKAEQKRVSDILALGEQHGCLELARQAVTDGTDLDSFKDTVLTRVYNAKKAQEINADIGMTNEDADAFSIVRAIRQIADKGRLDGIEKEASEATAKISRREPKGFFIPQDVMKRAFARNLDMVRNALSAGVGTSGGYLIGTEVLAADMIELLRNKTLVANLGARTLSGLVGNIAIPKQTGGATAYWLNETGEVTAADQAFAQLGLTPHRLVGDTAYSKELVMQSSIDVEAFVREDLMRVLAIAKDLSAINGSGVEGQPLGILNTTGIGSVTFGAAATWAKVIDFETQVANANADAGNMAYLTTPAVRGKWKGIAKASGYPVYLWENGSTPGSGIVNGYRAEATKQVPSDKVIFGNWSDLILAEWAGIDVVVDPYSLKKTGQIEVTITLWCDNGARHAGSFSVSADSGAQ